MGRLDAEAEDRRYLKAPVPHMSGGAAAGLRQGLFSGKPAHGLSSPCGSAPPLG